MYFSLISDLSFTGSMVIRAPSFRSVSRVTEWSSSYFAHACSHTSTLPSMSRMVVWPWVFVSMLSFSILVNRLVGSYCLASLLHASNPCSSPAVVSTLAKASPVQTWIRRS